MSYEKIAFVADQSENAQAAQKELAVRYNAVPLEQADIIVTLGGDGFMLRTLHRYMQFGKPFYGMNFRGTVGFLLNNFESRTACRSAWPAPKWRRSTRSACARCARPAPSRMRSPSTR